MQVGKLQMSSGPKIVDRSRERVRMGFGSGRGGRVIEWCEWLEWVQ